MASTFNLDIVRQVAQITAMETRGIGIPWNFNPVLDSGRQPLWSRLFETYGEDVYLATEYAEAYIRAHEGDDLTDHKHGATCMKHFIGYSLPVNGKDRTPALIPEIVLREHFLPPFERAVKANSLTVMINSGEVNSVPGHANSYYINDILKGELGFEGFAVSDWEDILRLNTRDDVSETIKDGVRLSIMAGLDMSMVPFNASFFHPYCVELYEEEAAFRARADDAVTRILNVKEKLGLFESYYPVEEDLKNIGTDDSHAFNLQAAREAVILAKNEKSVLPLAKTAKVLVTGPTGDLLRILNGGWSYSW
jgi:beta-glucosidase